MIVKQTLAQGQTYPQHKKSPPMKAYRSSRAVSALLLSLVLVLSMLLFGCSNSQNNAGQNSVLDRPVVIGSMVTEDILPMWVAEAEGIFAEYGIEASVVTFQSAQELATAVVSGSVDMAMTDILVAATITASGTPVTMEWVTLGTTAEQGRFGIMTSPASGITSLKELAGVPIGVGSNTLTEYVMYGLLKEAGLTDSEIVSAEIKKVPVRYEMMASNQVAAAVLPGSLLALGEATGMVLLADDTTGENLSQSVMIVRNDLGSTSQGRAMVKVLAQVWNDAVGRINANPESYRGLLIEMAKLPDPVRNSYRISEYPTTQKPTSAMVNPILDWMYKKGYLGKELSYVASTGSFVTSA